MAHFDEAFFNAHHSPAGAFASFTLGCKGAKGGFGLELGGPANQSVYVGVETATSGAFEALPFYEEGGGDAERYTLRSGKNKRVLLSAFKDAAITRTFSATEDKWEAGDLSFTIFSPWLPLPEPGCAEHDAAARRALMPAVFAELTIDNTKGKRMRRAFFGFRGNEPLAKMRRIIPTECATEPHPGIALGTKCALVCANRRDAHAMAGFSFEHVMTQMERREMFSLGDVGLVVCEVPAGKTKTFIFALAFYHGGIVTSGIAASYYYTHWFKSVEEVAETALRERGAILAETAQTVRRFKPANLPPTRRFQFAHALRSYYGSTQCLRVDDRPLWVVNEGEYRMMNTLDLTADMVFFELLMNPWTVRNTMELFAVRYAYHDAVRKHGAATEYQGGIAFTHDMGVMNNFMPPGHSSYERPNLDGCFSYMSHEELTNWVLCAASYVAKTGDRAWFTKMRTMFIACFDSLCQRDNPNPALRNGIMSFEGARCGSGAEITTYDSLDTSLGQSRNNLYLAVKDWAAYAVMAELFNAVGDAAVAQDMHAQALRCADTIVGAECEDGTLPAVAFEGVESRLIPVVEGVIFPWFCGFYYLLGAEGPFADLIDTLQQHIKRVLKPGVCLFADGGWKLSSSSDNSWLSKIYLCQFISRHIFGHAQPALHAKADLAHMSWLLDPENIYYAWSDQMVNGIARGSKYYPRGVTSILWMLEA